MAGIKISNLPAAPSAQLTDVFPVDQLPGPVTYKETNSQLLTLFKANGEALTRVNDTNVTLTLAGTPTTSLLNATSLTLGWSGTLSPTRGGTGVNNGSSTITLGGNLTTSGAFASTFTMTGTTTVTFPTTGTLATTSQIIATAAIAGTSQAAAVNTIYIASSASQTTLTLPSTFAVGSIIGLVGSTANTAGWIIATAAGDTIRLNNTTGASSGTLTSAATAGQCVELICDVANASWIVRNGTYTALTLS